MILIAHRGNVNGPNLDLENTPEYLDAAIGAGFSCEIDLWVLDGEKLFLGHDEPRHKIKVGFLFDRKNSFYIHAKNKEALKWLVMHDGLNYFSHDKDEFTLTSNGEVWCFPSIKPIEFGINLMPEWNDLDPAIFKDCYGVCSDYISKYKGLR